MSPSKSLNADSRVLLVKIDRLKKKIEEYEAKLDQQNDEFQMLQGLHEDHLNAYESAINNRLKLEEEIRQLKENQDERMGELMK